MVKGTKPPDLAEAFMNLMLDPGVQQILAETTFTGVTNRKSRLSPTVEDRCACGPRTEKLRLFDLARSVDVRPQWTERLTIEVLPSFSPDCCAPAFALP